MWHTITLPIPSSASCLNLTFNDTALEIIGVIAFLISVTLVTMAHVLDQGTYKDIILLIAGYFFTRIFGLATGAQTQPAEVKK